MATTSDLQAFAAQMAASYGIPTDLFLAQINQESSWNPNAKNGNAVGIAQFMPGTANQYGVDPTDPYGSLQAAAKYDADLYQQYGSWQTVMQKYGTTAGGNGASVSALASQYDNTQRTLIGSGAGVDVYALGSAGSGGSNPNVMTNDNTVLPDTGTSNSASAGLVNSDIGTSIKNALGGLPLIILGIILLVLAFVVSDKGQQVVKVVTP